MHRLLLRCRPPACYERRRREGCGIFPSSSLRCAVRVGPEVRGCNDTRAEAVRGPQNTPTCIILLCDGVWVRGVPGRGRKGGCCQDVGCRYLEQMCWEGWTHPFYNNDRVRRECCSSIGCTDIQYALSKLLSATPPPSPLPLIQGAYGVTFPLDVYSLSRLPAPLSSAFPPSRAPAPRALTSSPSGHSRCSDAA